MAFEASKITLKKAWEDLQGTAVTIDGQVTTARDASVTGPINLIDYLKIQSLLNEAITQWDAIIAGVNTTDLIAYVRDQISDPAYDVVTEYTTMRTAAIALRLWIFNNYPRDVGTDAVVEFTVDLAGNKTPVEATAGQRSAFITNADPLINAII